MALPFSFANVTTLVTSQLDANFNALGVLTPIPCTVGGTNTITLTPSANTSSFTNYSNYMQFVGVAAATNTSTTTGQVGSLSALNIYKDTPQGPTLLSGGEIVINCQFGLIYDSSLNVGNGGFHLITPANYVNINGSTVSGPVVFSSTVPTVFQNGASVSALLFAQSIMAGAGPSSLTAIMSTTSAITWPNIPANLSTTANVLLSGASIGDVVGVSPPASVPTGVAFFGWVPGAGSVTIRALNVTASSITPPAGTHRVAVQRYSP